jgi:N-methylhydantoinase B
MTTLTDTPVVGPVLLENVTSSLADRSILSCCGLKPGKAGKPLQVAVDPGDPDDNVGALADAEFVPASAVIRIRTTGGGGSGAQLDRDVNLVEYAALWSKGWRLAAATDYGVVLTGAPDEPAVDVDPPRVLRVELRADFYGDKPFFDRGPRYVPLAGGLTAAGCDHLGVLATEAVVA